MNYAAWHYPRTGLAQQYLDKLDLGLDQRLTLLERRRFGKTEFILRDLLPAAEERGYLPIYASMTDNAAAPQLTLIRALEEACEQREPAWKKLLRRSKFTVKVKPVAGVSAEAEIDAGHPAVSADEINHIHDLFDRLTKVANGKRILLLIDEIQHLTQRQFLPFSHALRNELDRKRNDLVVVFVGSTQGGLRMAFGREHSPFFGFGVQMPFPYLDNDFPRFIANKFESLTGRNINVSDEAVTYFNRVDRNPEYFMNMVSSLQLNPKMTWEKAYLYTREKMAAEDHFESKYESMKPLDKLVYKEIAGHTWILNAKTRSERYARALGELQPVDEERIRKSLARLTARGLISPAEGGYWLNEAVGFKRWLDDREAGLNRTSPATTLREDLAADKTIPGLRPAGEAPSSKPKPLLPRPARLKQ